MSVRLASVGDIPAIAALAERYWEFESIPGFDRARAETLLHDFFAKPQLGACWVAEDAGRLQGYLLAVFMFSLEHGGMMAEIDEVFVSQERRSTGVGSLLVTTAARELDQRGLLRLQLQLGIDNERARLFYELHGFRRRAGYVLFDKALV